MKIAATYIALLITLLAGCTPSKSKIEESWQRIVESTTAEEEYNNAVYFSQNCLSGLSISFELLDGDGVTHTYSPYDTTAITHSLPKPVSISLIAFDGKKELCRTSFWKPKSWDSFYYLFYE